MSKAMRSEDGVMKNNDCVRLGRWLLCVAVAGMLCSCRKSPEDATAKPPTGPIEVTPSMLAALVRADAADGKEDHLVAKCILCQLHMNGQEANAATLGNYTVHLCSAYCKQQFEADPSQALNALPRSADEGP